MVNVVPLDRQRYLGKGWRRPMGYTFAERDAVVVLVGSEFPKAALALPIAFVEQSSFFVPVMLTSPVPGCNAALGPTGQWLIGYVPAALRTYPFSLAPAADPEHAVLSFDEDSGLLVIADDSTEKFFESDGSLSPNLSSISRLLRETNESRIATNRAVVALSDAGLIKRWPLVVPVGNQDIPVSGLYCVDEAALNALDDGSLVEVRRALPLAYAQLLSMGQIGVLSRLALIQQQIGMPLRQEAPAVGHSPS
jgi:hypothetical protein